MVELACGLKRRGHSVEMFAYFPARDFFRPRLDEQQIAVHEVNKGEGFSPRVVRRLAGVINARNIDVVVSYLNSPNIYAELARLAVHAKLIVSERTSHLDDQSHVGAVFRRVMHCLADHVVANSHAQCEWLTRKWWLKGKVSCIYNGVDPGPAPTRRPVPESGEDLRLVAVGRVGAEKNAINLIRGLIAFHREYGYVPQVSWVGERDWGAAGRLYGRRLEQLLESSPEVRNRWRWLGVATDIPGVLREHHALVHPSLYEGLPNVVCEALAAGMPVLVSNVCDHARLVADGQRGFLFDPSDPGSIAAAIRALVQLPRADWLKFSCNARRYAEENLHVERMISAYESLFVRLLGDHNSVSGVSRGDCR